MATDSTSSIPCNSSSYIVHSADEARKVGTPTPLPALPARVGKAKPARPPTRPPARRPPPARPTRMGKPHPPAFPPAATPQIAATAKTVAVLGIKTESQASQPAFYVPEYLQSVGVKIIPVPGKKPPPPPLSLGPRTAAAVRVISYTERQQGNPWLG